MNTEIFFDGGSCLRLNGDPDLKLKSAGWCMTGSTVAQLRFS